MRIRAMRTGDIRAALRLWNAAPGTATVDTPAEIRRFLRRNPGGSFVAHVKGTLVGAVLGGHDGRRGTLWHLAVLPKFRRGGVGRALVDRAVGVLRARGLRKVNILVLADNRRAIRFWAKAGWSRFAVANFSLNLRARRG